MLHRKSWTIRADVRFVLQSVLFFPLLLPALLMIVGRDWFDKKHPPERGRPASWRSRPTRGRPKIDSLLFWMMVTLCGIIWGCFLAWTAQRFL